jgi:RNA polymerase sigma-70 factor (ECF subfamily)
LLARFRNGDAEVLDRVYRTYVRDVTRVVASALRRYGGGAAGWEEIASDLPDVVQEVFARAFDPRTRERFDGARDYRPFISQIAHNVTVDHLRRRQHAVPAEIEQMFQALSVQSPLRDAGAEFAERETATIVADYLANLPLELRRAHDLLYVRGLSEREAAAALGVGRQAVRTLGARLRDGLRQALEADEGRAQTARPRSEQNNRATQNG